jgi:hypothetical protein
MNKQRAQLAEPAAVQNYFRASALASDSLLHAIAGSALRDEVLANAINSTKVVDHIATAVKSIEKPNWFDAMIAIRKAPFVAYESDFDIREWNAPPEPESRAFVGNL